ncbi:hypothetical protein AAMO2058_001318800 [Amorphochlora amoebiformis]
MSTWAYFSHSDLNRIPDSPSLDNALILPVNGGKCYVEKDKISGNFRPVLLRSDDVACLREGGGVPAEGGGSEGGTLIWLGEVKGKRYFALEVSNLEGFQPPINTELHRVNLIAPSLEDGLEAALMATAVGKGSWHQNTKFCAKCGSKTYPLKIGSSRKCSNQDCGKSYFPRVDPAVIVLVTCKNHALLGRQGRWKTGRYSCIAGFVELGERLEDGLLREVLEETGVKVNPKTIRYVSSQPWPFPQSLMVGYQAEAHASPDNQLPDILVDLQELEDAQWVSREDLKRVMNGKQPKISPDFHIPGKHSLAWHLINSWLSAPATT